MKLQFIIKNYKCKGENNMKNQIKSFMANAASRFTGRVKNSKRGGGLVEFIVITAVIAAICTVTLTDIGGSIKQNSSGAVTKMNDLVGVSSDSGE